MALARGSQRPQPEPGQQPHGEGLCVLVPQADLLTQQWNGRGGKPEAPSPRGARWLSVYLGGSFGILCFLAKLLFRSLSLLTVP